MVDYASGAQSAAAAGFKVSDGRTKLFDNYETFLTLLTAQMKNQDPLSPMDATAFTDQLTSMAGVEQQLLTNDLLKAMVEQNSAGLTGAVAYIGKTVTAASSVTKLDEGKATWTYELGTDAGQATLEILDVDGKTVWTGPAPDLKQGMHDFTWDGKTTTGTQLPDGGVYTMKITAKTGTGTGAQDVASQVLIRGRTTAVEMYDGQPYLTVGGSIVPLSSVISVEEQKAAT